LHRVDDLLSSESPGVGFQNPSRRAAENPPLTDSSWLDLLFAECVVALPRGLWLTDFLFE
jgi:hypothetical protein